jgi:hypothetical protein
MTDVDELAAAVRKLAHAFHVLGVTWAIGGSIASVFHGEPRATNDLDVIADLDEANARRLPALLGESFYADQDAAVQAVRLLRSFNVIDTRTFIKIDIFVPGPGPLGVGQLDRRQLAHIFPDGDPLPVLGPEDTVLQKLRWFRLTGGTSDRQWRDVLSVLRLADELDDAYLDRVAEGGDLDELLARARADAAED